jgi:hypothetical protein
VIFCFGLVIAAVPPAAAGGPRHLDRPWFTQLHVRPLKGIPFSPHEEELIRSYFAANPQTADPVAARDVDALSRAKPLPRSVPRRGLPAELVESLTPRGDDEALIVGRDVVLVSARRGLIIDVLRNVL